MTDKTIKENIKRLTEILRTSSDPMVVGIRRCLEEKGLDIDELVIAEWFPDDISFEFGIVVTSVGGVFQFGYDYLNKSEDSGSFSEWENLTEKWDSVPLSESIAIALKQYDASP